MQKKKGKQTTLLLCGPLSVFRCVCILSLLWLNLFPGGSEGKEFACKSRDVGSVPGLEDALEEGTATHSSILAWRIPMDRRAWWAAVHGFTMSRTRLSD